jgi:hypothetical protein
VKNAFEKLPLSLTPCFNIGKADTETLLGKSLATRGVAVGLVLFLG